MDFDYSLASPLADRNGRRELLADKGWKRSGLLTLFTSTYSAPEVSTVVVLKSKMAGDWSNGNSDDCSPQAGIKTNYAPDSNSNSTSTSSSSSSSDDVNQRKINININSIGLGLGLGPIGWLGWNRSDNLAAAAVAADLPSIPQMKSGVSSPHPSTFISTSQHMNVVFREEFLVSSIFGADRIRDIALRIPFFSLKLRPFITIAVKIFDRSEIEQGISSPQTGLVFCNGGLLGESGMPFHVEGPFLQNPGVRHLPLPVSPDTYLKNAEQMNQVSEFINTIKSGNFIKIE